MSEQRDEEKAGASIVKETQDEHRACMQLLSEVEECLDRPPDDPAGWISDLKQRLTRLTAALDEHFTGEEAGPMFRDLPIRHPRLAGPLKQLEDEHKEMRVDLQSVRDKAEELDQPEVFELRELNARVQLFVARLRRHEAAENELVIQAYWDEVGVGD